MQAQLPRGPTISGLLTRRPGASGVIGSETGSLEASRVIRVSFWASPKAKEPDVLLAGNQKRQTSQVKQMARLSLL